MEKNLDKVYEAYMGEGQSDLEVKTRERIDWICSCTTGGSILDVGCSQGITSILLGRKGKNVIGIDIVEEAVEFAKEKLKLEEEAVQKRVSFVHANFLEHDFGDKKYDTVILTEVLEHLETVDDFVVKLGECMENDGTLILSVPFGINDYWDHKRTYYLGNLYEQLTKVFDIVQIKYIHKWLGVLCTHKQSGKNIEIDLNILKEEEAEFYKIERFLVDENNRLKQRCIDLRDKNVSLNEQKNKLKDKIESQKEALEYRQEKICVMEEKQKELKEKIEKQKEILEYRQEKIRVMGERQKELKEKIEKQAETLKYRQEKINKFTGVVRDLKNKELSNKKTVHKTEAENTDVGEESK